MNLLELLAEVRAIAQTGLAYSESSYDRERYERLLVLAAAGYGTALDLPPVEARARLAAELGYITPKVGADAAIFNQRGEILLMERADGGGWCLPCGFVDANEKPAESAVRETLEETGLHVAVRRLVGVFTRPAGPEYGPHALVCVVHWCEVVSGEPAVSAEGRDLRYWPLDEVPHWHGNQETYARAAHALWQSGGLLPPISN